ncbi:hypothetical protein Cgig2_018935 [Carnegiea gigantea]|uniref:Expansin B3 n=1 Tax=Carnegiea gigantea TaxID=171969 RepID=A0A9Q1K5F8_9CARY|nr:hypothetical protein Cgig2_018935 [Carnegiea gigantea]
MWSFEKSNLCLCLLGTSLSFGFGVAFANPYAYSYGYKVSNSNWNPAVTTGYGDPDGNGSNGGACGYGSLVDVQPFKARVTAVSPILFKNGEGCGACYMVKCLDKSICSSSAVTVIVTDECPGCSSTHFDLSGAAFGHLSLPGRGGQLRNRGILPVVYRRTPCTYPGMKISFRLNDGSRTYWLSLLVVFEGGDGDIGAMYIKQATSSEWMPMAHSWRANWYITGRGPLKGPFSVKLITLSTRKTLTARDVIPTNFLAGATYTSRLNL